MIQWIIKSSQFENIKDEVKCIAQWRCGYIAFLFQKDDEAVLTRKDRRAMKVETTKFKLIMNWSPSTRLSEVVILLLYEEEQDEWAGCEVLSLDE